jgi:hypothetical protein
VTEVPETEVLSLYDEGVDAFARWAGELTEEGWERRRAASGAPPG